MELCARDLERIEKMEGQGGVPGTAINDEQENIINEQKFWIAVNKAEAHYGLSEMIEYEKAAATAQLNRYEDWMMESFKKQLEKLSVLVDAKKELV